MRRTIPSVRARSLTRVPNLIRGRDQELRHVRVIREAEGLEITCDVLEATERAFGKFEPGRVLLREVVGMNTAHAQAIALEALDADPDNL